MDYFGIFSLILFSTILLCLDFDFYLSCLSFISLNINTFYEFWKTPSHPHLIAFVPPSFSFPFKYSLHACMLSLQSCLSLCNPIDCSLPGSSFRDLPGENTGVGCLALLQGIFPTQGFNPSLPLCRQLLYH